MRRSRETDVERVNEKEYFLFHSMNFITKKKKKKWNEKLTAILTLLTAKDMHCV